MKPGRERTKAWIYSVINPVLDGLRIEASFLEKENWTFRRHNRDLEFIRPTQSFVDYQSRPNWEDFTASNLKTKEKIDDREKRREELLRACGDAFANLVANLGFQQKVSESFAIFAAEAPGESSHRAIDLVPPNVKPYEVIAEFVVNNLGELPTHWGLHQFWSRFRDELMPFRFGAAFEDVDKAGLELKKSNYDLSTELIKVRSDLAAEYDIPWAPYSDESLSVSGR